MEKKIKDFYTQVTEIAEDNGWATNFINHLNGDNWIEFEKTISGKDMLFNVDLCNGNITEFLKKVYEFYENYDVDYEAYLWIGKDGHGMNGAPYHIKDIVEVEEETEKEILKLYDEFREKLEEIDD